MYELFNHLSVPLRHRVEMLRQFASEWSQARDAVEIRNCFAAQEAANIITKENRKNITVKDLADIKAKIPDMQAAESFDIMFVNAMAVKLLRGDIDEIMSYRAAGDIGGKRHNMQEYYEKYKSSVEVKKQQKAVQLEIGNDFAPVTKPVKTKPKSKKLFYRDMYPFRDVERKYR